MEKILEKTLILENMPLSGRIVPESDDERFRELIIGNYRIIYEYDKRIVHILTVHHSKRNLSTQNIFRDKP